MKNLFYRTSWQGLTDHFRQAGTVVSANVLREPGAGRSKGCGSVVFPAAVEAARAIQMLHSSELNGRSIAVREAHVRSRGGSRDEDSVHHDVSGGFVDHGTARHGRQGAPGRGLCAPWRTGRL